MAIYNSRGYIETEEAEMPRSVPARGCGYVFSDGALTSRRGDLDSRAATLAQRQ